MESIFLLYTQETKKMSPKHSRHKWIWALRKWNEINKPPSGFMIPKKDSDAYKEIQELMKDFDPREDIIQVERAKILIKFE
jgi:hypothetical protein